MDSINLTPDEQSLFDKLGVQVDAISARFTRPLDWGDITQVFCAILNHVRHDEENWKFAIGDCMIEMEKRFGKEKTDAFVNGYRELDEARKKALELTGVTLIQMQYLESVLKQICLSTRIAPLNLTPDDFINLDPQKVRLTLGKMKDAVLKQGWFTPEFELRLNEFNKERNRFVHTLWINFTRDRQSTAIPTLDEITEYMKTVHAILVEAHGITHIFLGLFGAFGVALQQNTAEKNEFLPYIPIFDSVRKSKSS